MMVKIAEPTAWSISPGTGYLRSPVRPLKARAEHFSELFDATTLAYDNVYLPDRGELVLLGPPLLNLKRDFSGMKITANPDGSSCKFHVREMNRHMRLHVRVPKDAESVHIESIFGDVDIRLSLEKEDIFSGRRVLLTLSRDNQLDWLCDWIRYHRDNHGADAVLLYDNGSRSYSVEEIAQKVGNIAGIEAACVVRWDYKYGPQGSGVSYWDSDFCQSGSLEDARWRYLRNAKSVVNLDIDELALTSGKSIFEIVEGSPSGYVAFHGLWVVDTRDGSDLASQAAIQCSRHRDFHCTVKPRFGFALCKGRRIWPTMLDRCPLKWAAVPGRHPDHVQWQAHRIRGIAGSRKADKRVEYRHFRPINTSWLYDRQLRETFSTVQHKVDIGIIEAFNNAQWHH